MDTFATNLPLQLTSFIGREREIVEVKRLLTRTLSPAQSPDEKSGQEREQGGEVRLLILTGGCGKTRLALQVAADLLDTFPDGVWLVEFASLSDPTLVPQAIVSVFDVRETSDRPLINALTNYLRAKNLLLVLDNCEHLVEACAQFAETLLRGCPSLRILATSREALGIRGETAWRVPSLAVPDATQLARDGQDPVSILTQSEAARLFVGRALAVLPTFRLIERNAAAVAQVCQRLDGMPSAIELAAARVKTLSVEEIAARLDDRFVLRTVGSRTALPRQQTLRATMDWSYGLLTEEDRVLFRRLAVFAGNWTSEAAEAVTSDERQRAKVHFWRVKNE